MLKLDRRSFFVAAAAAAGSSNTFAATDNSSPPQTNKLANGMVIFVGPGETDTWLLF